MQRALTNDQGVRKSPDSDEVAYPDNEVKKPAQNGPADVVDVTESSPAASANEKEAVVDKPHEAIIELCKKDGVTQEQVLSFAKSKKLCGEGLVELIQVSDDSLRAIYSTWPSVLPKIKAQKV